MVIYRSMRMSLNDHLHKSSQSPKSSDEPDRSYIKSHNTSSEVLDSSTEIICYCHCQASWSTYDYDRSVLFVTCICCSARIVGLCLMQRHVRHATMVETKLCGTNSGVSRSIAPMLCDNPDCLKYCHSLSSSS